MKYLTHLTYNKKNTFLFSVFFDIFNISIQLVMANFIFLLMTSQDNLKFITKPQNINQSFRILTYRY